MAEDPLFCEEILRVFLSDSGLKVIESHAQHDVTNLQGRSIILDAKCVTSDGRQINIEVQKANDEDHQRRVRYNGALITANVTDPGTRFEDIPDVCVVFISRTDFFMKGKSCYHVDRVLRETQTVVENGFEEIYINAKVKDDSDISALMDVFTKDHVYDDKKFPVTSESKRRYKETKGGQEEMCEIVKQIVNEELREAHEELRETHEKLSSTEKERDAALAEIARLKQELAQKEKAEWVCVNLR